MTTDHDAEARQRYVAAVRSHLAPLGKWGRPSAALTASTVKLIAEDGELYLKACRQSMARVMTRLDEARSDVEHLRDKNAGKERVEADLRADLASVRATLRAVHIERDQLRETIADLEGQLAVLRHTPAPEPPAAPPATPGKPRSARVRGATAAVAASDPASHTPVTPKPSARRTGRPGAAQ